MVGTVASLHLDELTQRQVIELHHGMPARGYKLATANRMVILLRCMYNPALKWSIPGAERNPAAGFQLLQANNARERFLTAEETQKLRAALEDSDNSQLRYIVPLLLLTGCRKRELLDSKLEHFDIERRTWRIPTTKAGKARHVPLSSAYAAV